jgi:hypothetical protein
VLRVPVVHAAQVQGDVKQDDFSAHLRKVRPLHHVFLFNILFDLCADT